MSSVDRETFNAYKALTDERIKSIGNQVQTLRQSQTTEIDAIGFAAFKASIENQLQAIANQLHVLRDIDSTEIDAVAFAAYKALVNEQITALNKQIQNLRNTTTVPSDLRDEFETILAGELNAGKIKGYTINVTDLAHNSILVFNNHTRQFECQLYHKPESVVEKRVYIPVYSDDTTVFKLTGITTDNTETELFIDSVNRISVDDNSTITFSCLAVGKQVGGSEDDGCYKIEGAIKNDSSGVTSLIGIPVVTTIARSNSVPWTVKVTASDELQALIIKAKGEVGKTISWTVTVNTASVVL